MKIRISAIVIALLLSALAASTAFAQKPSVVTKINGEGSVVKCSPTSDWLAIWILNAANEYDLTLINANDGEAKIIDTQKEPGGFCWLPNKNQLFYCRGKKTGIGSIVAVDYYVYDVARDSSTRLYETQDKEAKGAEDTGPGIQLYTFDPIPAEDGNKAVHMTFSSRDLTNINLYFTDSQEMVPYEGYINITVDYDLSSDGKKLFWQMWDETGGYMYVIGWDLVKNKYSDLYEYPARINPADNNFMFRVDEPNLQAASLAVSDSDPTLQLCVYGFRDEKNPTVVPLHLKQGEEMLYFDWKDRNSNIYAVVSNNNNGDFSIEEIEVLTGKRNKIVVGQDPISTVDYSPRNDTYFYTVLDKRKADKPQTLIIRLR